MFCDIKDFMEETFNIEVNFYYLNYEEKEGFLYYKLKNDYIIEIPKNRNEESQKIINFVNFYFNMREKNLINIAKENFINDILNFKLKNIDLMLNRSEVLGFNFYVKRFAILIEIEDFYLIFNTKNELAIQKYKEEFYKIANDVFKNEQDLISYIGDNQFVICKEFDGNLNTKIEEFYKKLKNRWNLEYKISIGDIYDMPGIEGIAYSYIDAKKYLNLGKKYLNKKNIYKLDNVVVFNLLTNLDNYSKNKFLNYIEDLNDYSEKEKINLKKIIEEFCENNFSISKTAKTIEISEEKLERILLKVNQIKNIDCFEFKDIIKLYISYKLIGE